MFERFTDRARRVIVLAQEEARALQHNYIGTEHLLLAILREGESQAARILQNLNVNPEEVRQAIIKTLDSDYLPEGEEAPENPLPPQGNAPGGAPAGNGAEDRPAEAAAPGGVRQGVEGGQGHPGVGSGQPQPPCGVAAVAAAARRTDPAAG